VAAKRAGPGASNGSRFKRQGGIAQDNGARPQQAYDEAKGKAMVAGGRSLILRRCHCGEKFARCLKLSAKSLLRSMALSHTPVRVQPAADFVQSSKPAKPHKRRFF